METPKKPQDLGYVGTWKQGMAFVKDATGLVGDAASQIARHMGYGPYLALRPSSLGAIVGLCNPRWNKPPIREVPETLRRWNGGVWFGELLTRYPGLLRDEDETTQEQMKKMGIDKIVAGMIDKASNLPNVNPALVDINKQLCALLMGTVPAPVTNYIRKHVFMARGKKFENKTLDRYQEQTGIAITDRNTEVSTYIWDGMISDRIVQLQLRGQLDGRQRSTGKLIELKNRVNHYYESDTEKVQCLAYLMMFGAEEVILLQAEWPEKGKYACKFSSKIYKKDAHWWRVNVEETLKGFLRNVAYLVEHEDVAVQFLSQDTSRHGEIWESVIDLAS